MNVSAQQFCMPLFKVNCVCYTVCGGMAEWTIAAVLKTAGLTAPGVRIPLLPPEKVVQPFGFATGIWIYTRDGYNDPRLISNVGSRVVGNVRQLFELKPC